MKVLELVEQDNEWTNKDSTAQDLYKKQASACHAVEIELQKLVQLDPNHKVLAMIYKWFVANVKPIRYWPYDEVVRILGSKPDAPRTLIGLLHIDQYPVLYKKFSLMLKAKQKFEQKYDHEHEMLNTLPEDKYHEYK